MKDYNSSVAVDSISVTIDEVEILKSKFTGKLDISQVSLCDEKYILFFDANLKEEIEKALGRHDP